MLLRSFPVILEHMKWSYKAEITEEKIKDRISKYTSLLRKNQRTRPPKPPTEVVTTVVNDEADNQKSNGETRPSKKIKVADEDVKKTEDEIAMATMSPRGKSISSEDEQDSSDDELNTSIHLH